MRSWIVGLLTAPVFVSTFLHGRAVAVEDQVPTTAADPNREATVVRTGAAATESANWRHGKHR
jgi:hypothetical protein